MKKYARDILNIVYKPLVQKYLLAPRTYTYEDIKVDIDPGVFHPGLFYSTKYLIEYLQKQNITSKNFLELGCGSGLISITAAKKGANSFASDISGQAVDCALKNSLKNNVILTVYQSDLFDRIPSQIFDYIIINPPFYAKDPGFESEFAWYCGSDYVFFKKLFSQVKKYIDQNSEAVMILSSECNIKKINELAKEQNIIMKCICTKKFLLETQFLFNLICF
jgi:release factor glutamine methyltransferase